MFSFSFPRCLKRLNDELDLLKGERSVTVRYDDEYELFENVFDFVQEQLEIKNPKKLTTSPDTTPREVQHS